MGLDGLLDYNRSGSQTDHGDRSIHTIKEKVVYVAVWHIICSWASQTLLPSQMTATDILQAGATFVVM